MGFEGFNEIPSSSKGDIHTEPAVLKAQIMGNSAISQTCSVLNDFTKLHAAAADAARTIHVSPDMNIGVELICSHKNQNISALRHQ
jgi:hypothetical protein